MKKQRISNQINQTRTLFGISITVAKNVFTLIFILAMSLLTACGTTDSFTDANLPDLNTRAMQHIQLTDVPFNLKFNEAEQVHYLDITGQDSASRIVIDPVTGNFFSSLVEEDYNNWSYHQTLTDELADFESGIANIKAVGHFVEVENGQAFQGKGTATLKNVDSQFEVAVTFVPIDPTFVPIDPTLF